MSGTGDHEARERHLRLAKEQALELVRRGELKGAVASMLSDMDEYLDTKPSPLVALLGVNYAIHHDVDALRRWIEGFR